MNKENAREAYWRNERDNFVLLDTPDVEMITKLIDLARDGMPLEKFARKCGLPIDNLYSAVKGRQKKGMNVKDMFLVSENAAPGSGVTLDRLLAANGYVRKEVFEQNPKAKKAMKSLRKEIEKLPEPVKKTRVKKEGWHRGSAKKEAPEAEKLEDALKKRQEAERTILMAGSDADTAKTTPDQDGEDKAGRDSFITDLSGYARGKSESELCFLRDNLDLLYHDSSFPKILILYRQEKMKETEDRTDTLKEFYRNKDHKAKLTTDSVKKSDVYRMKLDEIVKGYQEAERRNYDR